MPLCYRRENTINTDNSMKDLMKERKERIVEFMKQDAYKPLLFRELAYVFGVPKSDIEVFRKLLEELETEGLIFKNRHERYGVPERMNLAVGTLQGNESGYAFLIPDDPAADDIYIPAENLNGAMDADRVVARINYRDYGDRKAEGEVVRILKRANTTVVGTFEKEAGYGFVVPDNRKISWDIFVSKENFNNAKSGQKVVVEILRWPEKRRNPEGRIVEILGYADEPGVDILSIIKAHNLRIEFPRDVIDQVSGIPQTVTQEMTVGRRDLRNLKIVTIDDEDAKDLDDAISIEKLPDGTYRLGVHIADVSYYVKENTPLDREALKRGTSVYLVDRVLPMLPAELSNGICSLNPGVDRLAFTVMMDIDSTGKVKDHEIFESVIRVTERMTYSNVYKILAFEDSELMERYSDLVEDFRLMEELAQILRNRRMSRGSLDFNFEEAKVILDDEGKPVDVRAREITIANRIIEEFMLICNETVAEHFFWANAPFVYRIHEDPDTDKMASFAEFVHNLGYHVKGINKIHPGALQELLFRVKDKKEERIINTVMLRSLKKARYSHENAGHFGLAAKHYCHFTSPIRRYPDLIIHRIMKEYIRNGMSEARFDYLNEVLPEIARQCSERERAAEEAERETVELKKVEYMKQREGEIFEGIVSNVTSFGIFVELDNTVEGLVRLSSMHDDYYIYNEKNYCVIGERTKKTYKIGDAVTVRLENADIATRKIEFTIVEEKKTRERKKGVDSKILVHITGGKKKKKALKKA